MSSSQSSRTVKTEPRTPRLARSTPSKTPSSPKTPRTATTPRTTTPRVATTPRTPRTTTTSSTPVRNTPITAYTTPVRSTPGGTTDSVGARTRSRLNLKDQKITPLSTTRRRVKKEGEETSDAETPKTPSSSRSRLLTPRATAAATPLSSLRSRIATPSTAISPYTATHSTKRKRVRLGTKSDEESSEEDTVKSTQAEEEQPTESTAAVEIQAELSDDQQTTTTTTTGHTTPVRSRSMRKSLRGRANIDVALFEELESSATETTQEQETDRNAVSVVITPTHAAAAAAAENSVVPELLERYEDDATQPDDDNDVIPEATVEHSVSVEVYQSSSPSKQSDSEDTTASEESSSALVPPELPALVPLPALPEPPVDEESEASASPYTLKPKRTRKQQLQGTPPRPKLSLDAESISKVVIDPTEAESTKDLVDESAMTINNRDVFEDVNVDHIYEEIQQERNQQLAAASASATTTSQKRKRYDDNQDEEEETPAHDLQHHIKQLHQREISFEQELQMLEAEINELCEPDVKRRRHASYSEFEHEQLRRQQEKQLSPVPTQKQQQQKQQQTPQQVKPTQSSSPAIVTSPIPKVDEQMETDEQTQVLTIEEPEPAPAPKQQQQDSKWELEIKAKAAALSPKKAVVEDAEESGTPRSKKKSSKSHRKHRKSRSSRSKAWSMSRGLWCTIS